MYQVQTLILVWHLYPSVEQNKTLWPLIEKWEGTGSLDDLDALQSAVVGVWRAHNPDIDLSERGSISGDDEDKDDEDDEVDKGNTSPRVEQG